MRSKSRYRASLLPSRLPLPRVQRLKQRAMTTMRARQDAREPGALSSPGVSTRRTNNGSEHEGEPTSGCAGGGKRGTAEAGGLPWRGPGLLMCPLGTLSLGLSRAPSYPGLATLRQFGFVTLEGPSVLTYAVAPAHGHQRWALGSPHRVE